MNRRRAGSSSQMPSQLDHAARGSDVLPWGCWKLGAGHGKAKCDSVSADSECAGLCQERGRGCGRTFCVARGPRSLAPGFQGQVPQATAKPS